MTSRPKAHQLQAGAVYVYENVICNQSEESSSDDSFCLKLKIQCTQASFKKVPTPSHPVTNLVYRLIPHHTRNQCLRARLDTCADMNIMPAMIYRLVLEDQDLKKLAPSTMEIGTYTTDMLKIVGSFIFYFGPPRHQEVTESDILCCGKWWECLALMHNYTCAWIKTTNNKAWLLTPKG